MNGTNIIDQNMCVADVVSADYRTASVFRKYGIDFCCGGKWPLKIICETKNLDPNILKKELEESTRTIAVPNTVKFEDWDIDFLTAYIVNIHHQYLRKALPEGREYLEEFMRSHQQKFSYLGELFDVFMGLTNEMLPHLTQEEEIIFPYITQIAHAYQSKESYAGLLIRTLRKPVENIMHHEHESVNQALRHMRHLTNHYTLPPGGCVHHKVTFARLLEIDNDLVQHMHLENDILFPRAISMEQELLARKDHLNEF